MHTDKLFSATDEELRRVNALGAQIIAAGNGQELYAQRMAEELYVAAANAANVFLPAFPDLPDEARAGYRRKVDSVINAASDYVPVALQLRGLNKALANLGVVDVLNALTSGEGADGAASAGDLLAAARRNA